MWRVGISLAAGAMILCNGYLDGVWTNRWERSRAMEMAIANIERIPMTMGDWQARSEKLDDQSIAIGCIEGYFLRHYKNKHNGKEITVLLMCGRPGPLSVHTPEVCYKSSGFQVKGAIAKEVQKYNEAGASAEFFSAKFAKPEVAGEANLRIRWSWAAGGSWVATEQPRSDFARYPVLYKMYVIQNVTSVGERADEAMCAQFLKQLMPTIDQAMVDAK